MALQVQIQGEVREYSAVHVLRRLLGMSRSYFGWYLILWALALSIALINLGPTEAFRRISNAATEGKPALLYSGLWIGLGSVAVSLIFEWTRAYLSNRLDNASTLALQSRIMHKLRSMRMQDYERYHTADLISRISDSASSAQSGLNANSLTILTNAGQLVFTIAYLLLINVRLTIGITLIAVLVPSLVGPLSKSVRKVYDTRWKVQAESNAKVQDAVQGAEVVRSYLLNGRLTHYFRENYNRIVRLTRRALVFENIMNGSQFVVILGGIMFVFGYGGYMVVHHLLNIGGLVAFVFSFERVAQPLNDIARSWPQLQQSISSANRVFELLDQQEEGSSVPFEVGFSPNHPLEFQDVSFSYTENQSVLRHITLVAQPLQTTALVGPSGGGKSTLIKLLLRFHEPTSGSVFYGTVPINQFDPSQWRSRIAYVSQEPYLFSGSIMENIRMGRQSATDDEVMAAAAAANIHEVIMRMPDGYHTLIGERGTTLSGGEKQRVSMARALLKDPEILLLDEPTSALDSESEQLVGQALERLMRDRTTIVVAHRLSTIRDAHKIVYIEGGMVCEAGTHDELMRTKGKYFTMYQSSPVLPFGGDK